MGKRKAAAAGGEAQKASAAVTHTQAGVGGG